MSDDGSSDPYEEPTMEIVVETLTGTTFEMTVSPDDTIMSIKSKIQRVEGIPVSQQHLLHQLKELNNEDRLCDHGVTAGSTLRLVLSMRGGPISTRRLASSEHHLAWRELKDYVDTTREDMIDKLPPGAKVTVLLFRDGENINLIRVIENEDGTCYPYSDSWPPSRNAPKETSQAKYRERTSENNTMMHKVIELRRKMEGLSMQKKAKKPTESEANNEEEPSTSRLNVEAMEDEENPRLFGPSTDQLRVGKSVSGLYSDRFLLMEQRRNTRLNLGRSHRPHRLESSISKTEDISMSSHNCTSIQAPSIAILEEESDSALNKKEPDFSPPSPISVASGDANTVTMSQIPSLSGSSRNLLHLAHVLRDPDRPKTSPDKYDPDAQKFCNVIFNDAAERSHNVKVSVSNRRQSVDRMHFASSSNLDKRDSNLLTSQYASTSKLNSVHLDNMTDNSKFNNERTEHRSPLYGRRARIERIRNNISENTNPEKYGYSNLGYIEKIQNDAPISKQPHLGRVNFVSNLEPRNTCDPASFELRSFKLPRRRCTPQETSTRCTPQETSTRRCTQQSTKKSQESRYFPQDTSTRCTLQEATRRWSPQEATSKRWPQQEITTSCFPQDTTTRRWSPPEASSKRWPQQEMSTSCTRSPQDSTSRRWSPQETTAKRWPQEMSTSSFPQETTRRSFPQEMSLRRCSPQESASTSAGTSQQPPSSSQQSLPAIAPKKPPKTRCAFCNKRLNITNIHTCRCGGIFCSQHRYSEVHGCQYDYKTEGRKILEQANPLVAAPKLPKI